MPASTYPILGVRVRLDGYLSRLPKGYALGNSQGRAIEVRFPLTINKRPDGMYENTKDVDALYVDGDVSCEGVLAFTSNDIPYLKCDKITHDDKN